MYIVCNIGRCHNRLECLTHESLPHCLIQFAGNIGIYCKQLIHGGGKNLSNEDTVILQDVIHSLIFVIENTQVGFIAIKSGSVVLVKFVLQRYMNHFSQNG